MSKKPGKDTAAPDTTASQLSKRAKPTLTKFGNRIVPSDGRFHPHLCAEYIRDYGRERSVPVGELARVFYSGNTPRNKMQIRRNLFRVWNALVALGTLMVVEIDQRKAQACKIFNPDSTEEQQNIAARIERMEKQRFLKTEQVEKATKLALTLIETTK